ncbi:MAG: alkaline phosphatase [Treponema sp.]|jgi:arylsulfatase A-like enzyme|nr:alkaline phosphatase [Treponema sp.]
MIQIKTIRTFLFCAVLCVLFFVSGCAVFASKEAEQYGKFVPARHLVFIGLDGWGGVYVKKADMPTVKRMISGGASSLDTRCVMPSISWPNWSSLFCGTPPERRTGEVKREASENRAAKTIDDFPSIFSVVNSGKTAERSGPAFFYEWGELQKICPDEAAEKFRIQSDLESARRIAVHIMEKKPVFTAVVFDEPDPTGHSVRWGSKAYYAKLAELDNLVAVIEQAVIDAGIYDSTVFVLSADHGGLFRGHGSNISSHRKIPLVIYGGGIKKGFAIPSPTSICDIAPTMAAILGLEAPLEWTGRALTKIF